ncbi:MAG: TonB-dependent receptor [Candidatus Omnitrophica bacterium]|nr:TonB-dependent receptor [Candidatus Omnitrophota bacterium]MBU4473211.1 TonB-dependent receptor [Candidatus Omnitrophota bacterium]
MLKINRYGLFFLIIIFSNITLAFGEEDLSFDLEPIIITKSKVHLLVPHTVESDKLENLPFSSPIEALSILPIDLQSRSLKTDIQTDFSLRGSTYQGVLVLIDGQRVNDPKLGHYNCDLPITREDIQRIEVIPGVGSSVFGPDAIGGAINIILKKPIEKQRVLESSFGSYQTKSGIFSITEKIDNLGMRFSLERQESNGFYYDTDFKRLATTFQSSLDIPDGEFNFGLGYMEKEFGAYDFYTPGLGYPSKEWIKAYTLNAGLNLERQGFIIKPNFSWRRHYDKFMLDKTFVRSTSLNHHRSDVYTPNIYFQKNTEGLGRIGLGLEYGQERVSSTVLGKHNRNHKSIFMDDSKDLTSKLSLGLSARIDDYNDFNQAYAGSLNLRYKVSDEYSLHSGISRSIRIPAFHELYYSDSTSVGDAGLSCEKSLNYESGLDYEKEKFSTGITFFLRQEEDIIDWIKRTSSQAKWQAENITEADVFGIEGLLRLELAENLILDSNYAYINKRINDQSYLYKYGPNYIRHLANTVFSFNSPFGVQTMGLTYKKKPIRDGWVLLGIHLSYNLNKNSKIFLKGTNILNVEYQEIEGIPQPGRWLEAGVRFEW